MVQQDSYLENEALVMTKFLATQSVQAKKQTNNKHT